MKTQGQNVWVVWVWLLLCSVGVWAGQIISPSMKYTIMTGLDARGIVYDAHADRLYAVVIRPEQAPARYVAVIDPYLGVVESTFGFGEVNVDFSAKYNMALSDDGQYLYIVTHDGHRITRIDLTTRQVDLQIELPGRGDQTSNGVAYDIVVLPGQPRAVAMTHAIYNTTSGMKWTWKVRIYDDNVMRPTEAMVPMTTTQFSVGAQLIQTTEPSVLCLYDQAGGLRRIAVDGAGASLIETIETGWGQMSMKDLKHSGGMVMGVPVDGAWGYFYDLLSGKVYSQVGAEGTPLELDRSLNGFYSGRTTGLYEFPLVHPSGNESYVSSVSFQCGTPRDMVRFGPYGLAMTTASKQIILGQRKVEPIIYYKMDETSGTVVKNSGVTQSQSGLYNGVLQGNLLQPWVTGRWGNALGSDGKSNVRASYPGIIGTLSRTCAAWVKTADSDGGAILTWGEGGNSGSMWQFRIGASGKLEVDVYGGLIQGQMIVNDGKWHHVAAVLPISEAPKVSDIRLYVDGILESMPIITNPNTLIDTMVRNWYLVVGGQGNQPPYAGLLDEVRIYDVALEEEEIWRLIWPVPELPAAYWMMDESSGSVVRDCVGGHDGTLVNATDEMRMAGRNGNALFLDGVDDYVTVPGYKGVTGKASRTCSAWVKTTRASGQIIGWGGLETGKKWVVRLDEVGTYTWEWKKAVVLRAEVQNGWIVGTTPLNDGQWHHVAIVLDSDGTPDISEVRLYVDGVRDMVGGMQACAIDTAVGQDVGIGGFIPLPQYFGGFLDDVRVYDIALDEVAISALCSSIDKYLTNQPSDPMRDEPLAHWTLDETAGVNVADSLGGHPGKLVNNDGSGAWVGGMAGGALMLDGVDDYVTIPGFKGVTGMRSRSCMAWIKTAGVDGQILSWGTNATGQKWVVRVNGNGTLRAEVQNGWVYGTTAINDGQWHHIAVVLDSDGTPTVMDVRLYVDGVLDGGNSYEMSSIDTGSDQDVTVGAFLPQPKYFAGLLDDVRIYDYAVSGAVVANQVSPYVVDEPAAYWAMDETSGVEVADSIGGHTGYLLNSDGSIRADGVSGQALVLDGVDDYVTVPGYKGVTGKGSRSCTAWIKTTRAAGQIVSWGSYETGRKWVMRVNENGTLRAEVQNGWIYGMTPI
ncbi:MAG TPA: LamG domain-containing protein, partial [Anaerohalosphaeraceae bacterium]|nr:LamG domain-containing protein [Anaerohalosphaeraceae bacterium]